MRRIGMVVVLALALSGLAASSAFAKAKVLNLKTAKGPLAAGQELKATSSDLKFVAPWGNIECESSTLLGVLETNMSASDAGTTEGSFTGSGPAGACEGTSGRITDLKAVELPWPLTLNIKGTAVVKKAKFTMVFLDLGGAKCLYAANTVSSTFNIGAPMVITVTGQIVKRQKGSSVICPKAQKLSATFHVTSQGEVVEAAVE